MPSDMRIVLRIRCREQKNTVLIINPDACREVHSYGTHVLAAIVELPNHGFHHCFQLPEPHHTQLQPHGAVVG